MFINLTPHGVGVNLSKKFPWELNDMYRSAEKNHVCQPHPHWGEETTYKILFLGI